MKPLIFVLAFILIVAAGCGDDETSINPPQGCSNPHGVFATQVLDSDLHCIPTNAFTDTSEALGGPDARQTGTGKTEFDGMLSLGVDGSVTLTLGTCAQDLDGPDIRVFQVVSEEAVEVQVSQNPNGPFVTLGAKNCGELSGGFSRKCDFDLAGSGLNNARFVKVIDRETLTFPGAACDDAGLSPGADLDAVEVLHP